MYRQSVKRRRQDTSDPSANDPFSSSSSLLSMYPSRLNFYDASPQLEITIEDFEQWAVARMKVLGELESMQARNMPFKEIESAMKIVLDKHMPMSSNAVALKTRNLTNHNTDQGLLPTSSIKSSGTVDYNSEFRFDERLEEHRRLRDHYSHYILRLAFCRSDELSRRFVQAETTLFRIRMNAEDSHDRDEFIKTLDMPWTVATSEEKEQLRPLLEWSVDSEKNEKLDKQAGYQDKSLDSVTFFKIDFESVPDLVQDRRVVLFKGKAYVPAALQVTCLISEFSARLTRALNQARASVGGGVMQDDRLAPLVDHFALGFDAFLTKNSASGYNALRGSGEDEILAADVDGLASAHFPLCMQTMNRGLLATKHLRFESRREYGLFLRYIGLSVDEALKYWRLHFTNHSEDKFNKEYRYNVRHQYGLEGSRINYKPISCMDIASKTFPAKGEYHGCPYKTFTPENLASALERMGVNDKQDLAGIREQVASRQYNLACSKVYSLTHPADHSEEIITHPNQYFDKSWNCAKQK